MELMEKQVGRLRKIRCGFKSDGLFVGLFAKTYLAVIPIYLFYFLSSNRNFFNDLDQNLPFCPILSEKISFF